MSYVSEISNVVTGKKYVISTAKDTALGAWQTAVFECRSCLPADPFSPVMFTGGATDNENALLIHKQVEQIVANLPPADWDSAKWKLLKQTLEMLATGKKINSENDFTGSSQAEMSDMDASAAPLWNSFRGKANSKALLIEKAQIVASLVVSSSNIRGLVDAVLKDQSQSMSAGVERIMVAEAAILLIRLADEIAFRVLPAEERNIFTQQLEESVTCALADSGTDPAEFVELLEKRLAEYDQYKSWVPARNESAKGTLLWEVAKNIAATVNLRKSAVFNVVLGNLLLRNVERWQLQELLHG